MVQLSNELLMVFLPAISWFLFALGGTQIAEDNSIKGQKWIRRFVLPFVYLLTCFLVGVIWWQSLAVTVSYIIAFHLGYGDRTSWRMKPLVGVTYGLPTLFIGVSYWNLITAVMFTFLFFISNKTSAGKLVIWKVVEGFFGTFCGIQLAYLLMRKGLVWF